MKRLALLCILAIALPSCSGGAHALPAGPDTVRSISSPSPSPGRKHKKFVKVKIRVHVPRARRGMRHALYRRLSIASVTQGVQVVATGSGGSTTTAADISAASPNCSPSGTGRSCTFSISAPPGSVTFVFTTYDQVPVGGAIPPSANEIGAGVSHATINEGTANAPVGVTLGGVVASIGLLVTPPAIHTLTPSTATLQVFAYDADADAIVGSYVDPSGNPINLNVAISSSGCNCPYPLTWSPSSLSAPSATGVLITSTNYWYFDQSGPQSITVSASGGPAPNATGSIDLVDPVATHVSDSHLSTQGPFFGGIALLPSFDIVYSYNSIGSGSSSNGGVSDYNLTTSTLSSFTAPASAPVGGGLAYNGSNLFIAGPINLYTYATVPSLTVASGCTSTPCTGSGGSGILADASGDVWYGNGTNMVEYNGSSTQTFPVVGTPSLGMAIDARAQPRIWFANGGVGPQLVQFNTVLHTTTGYFVATNARPFDVMTDAAGMIWITDRSRNQLVEINPASQSTVATYNVQGGAPWYIVQDPLNTSVYWFDWANGGNVGIGRLDTSFPASSSNAVTQWTDNTCCYGGQPGALMIQNEVLYFPVDGGQFFDVVSP